MTTDTPRIYTAREYRDNPPPAQPPAFVVGVDLGQSQDYTAIAVVERVMTLTLLDSGDVMEEVNFHLRHLERPALGTKYTDIATRTVALLDQPPLTRDTPLVVDKTGVGNGVLDMFTERGVQPEAVTITGGDTVTHESHHYKVPKRELVWNLVALNQTRRLKFAEGLSLVPALINELVNFKVKIDLKTAHDSYEAWRESIHDDMVLAVALACWYAEVELPKHAPPSPEVVRMLRGMGTGDYQPWVG